MSDISAATSQTSATLMAANANMNMAKLANATKTASASADGKISEHDMKRIDKTAQDFEAVFITEMLRPMMNMVKVDPEFGGGKGEEVFRDFTLNEYGKKMAANGGLGIAQHVKTELIRMQEHKQ